MTESTAHVSSRGRTSRVIRTISYLLLVVAVVVVVVLAIRSGPYSELEKQFTSREVSNSQAVPVGIVVLTDRNTKDTSNYRGVLSMRVAENTIVIDPRFPVSLWMKQTAIPAAAVAACAKTCFGDDTWDADLLIERTGTEISLRDADQVLAWCWSNRIPVASSTQKRQWLYGGGRFPERANGAQSVSREQYSEQLRRSCSGTD